MDSVLFAATSPALRTFLTPSAVGVKVLGESLCLWEHMTMKVAIVGGGNMGGAIASGLLAAGWEPENIAIADHNPENRAALEEKCPGVRVVPSSSWAAADANVIVIAVKPTQVPEALAGVQSALPENALILSVAAGVTTGDIESILPNHPVVRAMPNTGLLKLKGASAIAPGANATEAHLDVAEEILGAAGIVVRVPEKQMDAITGLSGSGLAYIFLVAESMIDAGVQVGLARQTATDLVIQLLSGGAELMKDDHSPADLRAMVTSPGGTTVAGLRILEQRGVRGAFLDAIDAATKRSKELGEGKP